MSNGKGSSTAKRTNFKKFNEGWDNIDWGRKEEPPQPSKSVEEMVKEVKDKLDELTRTSQEMGLYEDKPTDGNNSERK